MKTRRKSLLKRSSQRIRSSLSRDRSVDSAKSAKNKIEVEEDEKASWPQTILFPEGKELENNYKTRISHDINYQWIILIQQLPINYLVIGTVTNGKAIIKFKSGAFYPGVPVQPMLLRPRAVKDSSSPSGYRIKGMDTLTWTMYQNWSPLKCMWFTLCQFHSNFVVRYLNSCTTLDVPIVILTWTIKEKTVCKCKYFSDWISSLIPSNTRRKTGSKVICI